VATLFSKYLSFYAPIVLTNNKGLPKIQGEVGRLREEVGPDLGGRGQPEVCKLAPAPACNRRQRHANLTCTRRQNAAVVLNDYLASVGGRDKIVGESQTALKTKKRGRPSAGGTPANGTKRRRNDDHPASATPPASTRAWKPPQGSWEDDVESIDACHDEHTGKLMVYLTWKNGQKTQHDTKVIYQRCPQKVCKSPEATSASCSLSICDGEDND
jgi:hypothetical protein